jgi:recombination protein RecR
MNSIDKLIQIFSQFPGIGPRQARRFVYYLLTRGNGSLEDLAQNVSNLKNEVVICNDCKRFFQSKRGNDRGQTNLCKICADPKRNREIVMIVERDIDLESVEKNGSFDGTYFVLGGSIPILEKEPEKRIRAQELKNFITQKTKNGLKEIILGLNWNPEGENTGSFVEKFLKPIIEQNKIKISHLGKGLSMGAELEYTDPETMKNALRNRN